MAKKKPWELLAKINEFEANRLARKLNEATRALLHAQRQQANLEQARQMYVLRPDVGLPIALIRNQRAFLTKLDATLLELENNVDRLEREREGFMAAWRAAKGKAEGYEQLVEAEKMSRALAMSALDQQRIEEIAGVAKLLDQSNGEHEA